MLDDGGVVVAAIVTAACLYYSIYSPTSWGNKPLIYPFQEYQKAQGGTALLQRILSPLMTRIARHGWWLQYRAHLKRYKMV